MSEPLFKVGERVTIVTTNPGITGTVEAMFPSIYFLGRYGDVRCTKQWNELYGFDLEALVSKPYYTLRFDEAHNIYFKPHAVERLKKLGLSDCEIEAHLSIIPKTDLVITPEADLMSVDSITNAFEQEEL